VTYDTLAPIVTIARAVRSARSGRETPIGNDEFDGLLNTQRVFSEDVSRRRVPPDVIWEMRIKEQD
jgi:hypothetical protein